MANNHNVPWFLDALSNDTSYNLSWWDMVLKRGENSLHDSLFFIFLCLQWFKLRRLQIYIPDGCFGWVFYAFENLWCWVLTEVIVSMEIVNCYGHWDGQTQTVARRKWRHELKIFNILNCPNNMYVNASDWGFICGEFIYCWGNKVLPLWNPTKMRNS